MLIALVFLGAALALHGAARLAVDTLRALAALPRSNDDWIDY